MSHCYTFCTFYILSMEINLCVQIPSGHECKSNKWQADWVLGCKYYKRRRGGRQAALCREERNLIVLCTPVCLKPGLRVLLVFYPTTVTVIITLQYECRWCHYSVAISLCKTVLLHSDKLKVHLTIW